MKINMFLKPIEELTWKERCIGLLTMCVFSFLIIWFLTPKGDLEFPIGTPRISVEVNGFNDTVYIVQKYMPFGYMDGYYWQSESRRFTNLRDAEKRAEQIRIREKRDDFKQAYIIGETK